MKNEVNSNEVSENEKELYSLYNKERLVRKILDNDVDLASSNIDEKMLHELINGKVAQNINVTENNNSTFGQRSADKIASFGGSWPFIIIFAVVLIVWLTTNTIILGTRAFDPYPFILMNLILSCLAAIQAPIIMMSQNRQGEKDRLTASNDYLVNLKTEIIIEDLHKKLDALTKLQNDSKEELLKVLNKSN